MTKATTSTPTAPDATPTGTAAPPDPGATVEVRAVTRTFGKGDRTVHAVGPIDLDVAGGEFVSIVGPSGCGKSTLLRVIAGLVRPTAGTVRLEVAGSHPLAMIFQDYGIYPWKRVLDNVRFGLDMQGVPRRRADERARGWLERMGLAEFASAWPDALSGGMRQRVSIARAMAAAPEVLLMDEPFAALDAQLRAVLQEDLLAICQAERRTVVFVTHSLSEAILLSDRVVVMSARPGRILLDRTIPFPRPRTPEVRASAEFAAIEDELWHMLRGQVTSQLTDVHATQPPSAPEDRP